MRNLIYFVFLSALVITPGCIKKSESQSLTKFEKEELEKVVLVVVDMSGSFAEKWKSCADDFFEHVVKKCFANSLGSNSKLIIAQLSANSNSLIWEGRPSDLARDFQTPGSLAEFLVSKSNPDGSLVNESLSTSLNHIQLTQGLTQNTKVYTLVLSDLMEYSGRDEAELEHSKAEMISALQQYGELNSAIGLYYVHQPLRKEWIQHLTEAKIPANRFIVETAIVNHPAIPNID